MTVSFETELLKAIQLYWNSRNKQGKKQGIKGVKDTGSRSHVTGGKQMLGLEKLIARILEENGVPKECIFFQSSLELPGYYRPEKKWDLVVVKDNVLYCALELKSQVGPSFGNNANNRVEEALGNASDIWTAYREGRFGDTQRPFLGYFFLLEDCDAVRKPVRNSEPHFSIDPVFKNSTYLERYRILCQRLVRERMYDAACLVVSTKSSRTKVIQPFDYLSFENFIKQLIASVSPSFRK